MAEIKDSTLIDLKYYPGILKFILILALVFIPLTAVWYKVSFNFLKYKEPITFTTTEINFIKFVKELNKPDPQVVIVGTSVADRLIPEVFSISGVTNLAVPGGSTMTGLEVLVNQKIFPKLLYIETDFVRNPADDKLVENFKTKHSNLKLILQGLIKPLPYLISGPFLSYKIDTKDIEEDKAKNLAMLPDNTIDQKGIIAGANAYKTPAAVKAALDPAINVKKIAELTKYFESHGTKVFYLHVPLSRPYEETNYFIENRVAVSGSESYSCERCVDLKDMKNSDELRWGDGVHLDYRSLILTINELEKHTKEHLIP